MFTQIRKEPLTAEEKKKLRFVLKTRLIIGAFFCPLLILGFILIGVNAINDMINGTPDTGTYFGIVLICAIVYLMIRFVIPFYKKSIKNLKREDKLVVNTVVLSVEQKWTSKGYKYLIQTEYRYIDSWSTTTIMKPSLPFHEMGVNMPITIHCFEDNKTDILYIEKTR
ncbi:hypothetical protein NZD88_02605 [Chryseobacterium antibioticum]|uniref:YcxB family protein n=1 Tax=Chryseobacterium pyrolae TaxID=2987481 RepID=A0ABT2ICU2_9FLAO|nr:hypothetical protein [Chryseobacterium pyrolae]MCT2406445.1 hypothetical protein [Chryseobacterium pyrolae]